MTKSSLVTMEELPNEILLTIVDDMSYQDKENFRRTSRRFSELLQKKCIKVPNELINSLDLSGRLSGREGVLCGHIVGRQFVGPVKIRFNRPDEYLEGKVKVIHGNTIVRSMIPDAMIPVSHWIHNYTIGDKRYGNLLNFDDRGRRDEYCIEKVDEPDQIVFQYDHDKLMSTEYTDKDEIVHIKEYENNIAKYSYVIYRDRIIRYEVSEGYIANIIGGSRVENDEEPHQYLMYGGIKYALVFTSVKVIPPDPIIFVAFNIYNKDGRLLGLFYSKDEGESYVFSTQGRHIQYSGDDIYFFWEEELFRYLNVPFSHIGEHTFE